MLVSVRLPLRRFARGVLLAGLLAARARAGWEAGALAAIAAEARFHPFAVLRLEPGERLRYRVETVAIPPRIPFVSSGRAVTIESYPEFVVLGLDSAGYRVGMRVRTLSSDPEAIRVRAEGRASFILDAHGRQVPGPGPDDEAAAANSSQLFRDLTGLRDPVRPWSEERWSYFHASRMGIPRIRTICSYQPSGVDPASGNLVAAIDVRETPEERARGRGYHTAGTVEIDARGRLVRLETRGRLWKKVFLVTVAVQSRYQARLLGADEPVAELEALRP